MLRQVLEDKEKEISDAKDQLCQVKEDAIWEYPDSDAYLTQLGGTYANVFYDYLHQVKASFPDLDLSPISIDAPAQTLIQPVHSKSTDELFTDDALVDEPRGDRDTAPVESQIKPIEDSTRQPNEV